MTQRGRRQAPLPRHKLITFQLHPISGGRFTGVFTDVAACSGKAVWLREAERLAFPEMEPKAAGTGQVPRSERTRSQLGSTAEPEACEAFPAVDLGPSFWA